ncbi:MAG: hypothetical protein AB7S88_05340 [Candidatus Izemoplasmatales bacterium]
MYNVMKDSLFEPKKILNYRNKPFWFVAIYVLFLAVLMSIGTVVYGLAPAQNVLPTEATSGCRIDVETIVCDGENYVEGEGFQIVGIGIYFYSEDATPAINDIFDSVAFVLKGSTMTMVVSNTPSYEVDITPYITLAGDFDSFVKLLHTQMIWMLSLAEVLRNIVVFLIYTWIATLPLLPFKRFYSYKTLFKLVLFAATPFAVAMTFLSFIIVSQWVLMISLIVSYYSLIILRNSMFREAMPKMMASQAPQNHDPEHESDEDEEDDQS